MQNIAIGRQTKEKQEKLDERSCFSVTGAPENVLSFLLITVILIVATGTTVVLK